MNGDADLLGGLAPLLVGDRGGVADFVRFGALALADAEGRLVAWCGDPSLIAFLRSSAKPFQCCAFLRRGLDRQLGLSDDEIACACASHQGEPRHLAAARRILAAADLSEDQLLCGVHDALDPDLATAVATGAATLSPIHNNCSGKHAAMLATCLDEGWPTETYTEEDHPLQRENLATLAAFAGVEPASVGVAQDNCTVPTFALPLAAAARAAARLGAGTHVSDELARAGQRALDAMAASPGLVAGRARLDTAIIESTDGRLVAKTGANGFYLVVERAEGGSPGRGLALKLGGAEPEEPKAAVVVAVLTALGMVTGGEQRSLDERFAIDQRGCRGARVGGARFVAHIERP